tara:strand:+ start:1394 stop:1645 length:252 start_codon:yes stop_codon:yes gene_type:complete
MSNLLKLFGGKITCDRDDPSLPPTDQDDFVLTDSEYHFAIIHSSLAHDDGLVGMRAQYIVSAVNSYENLLTEIAELKQRIKEQ